MPFPDEIEPEDHLLEPYVHDEEFRGVFIDEERCYCVQNFLLVGLVCCILFLILAYVTLNPILEIPLTWLRMPGK